MKSVTAGVIKMEESVVTVTDVVTATGVTERAIEKVIVISERTDVVTATGVTERAIEKVIVISERTNVVTATKVTGQDRPR